MSISVTELTHRIKRHLEPSFKGITVQGEISNFKAQSSGHYYFTLKDEGSQISVSFFNAVRYKFPRIPKDGDKVILLGDITVYGPRGNYQLVACGLKFVGVGDLLLRFHQLKIEIQELGWFNKEAKKSLPDHPKTIGVITSPTGAVIQDIIHVLSRRRRNFHLILYPVKVQGEGAKEEIAQAINEMNRYNLVDVMIVGRGGGSIEDLWAFNEKIVAEAIFHSKIPIISAVGHETDFTIADFVADVRAPTPSSAAEMVCPKSVDLLERFLNLQKRLDQRMEGHLSQLQQGLDGALKHPFVRGIRILHPFIQQTDHMIDSLDFQLRSLFSNVKNRLEVLTLSIRGLEPKQIIKEQKNSLLQVEENLKNTLLQHLANQKKELEILTFRLEALDPAKKLEEWKNSLLQVEENLKNTLLQHLANQKKELEILTLRLEALDPAKKLEEWKHRFSRLIDHLKALNPKQILQRGFCIPQNKKGAILCGVEQVQDGEEIDLLFYNGTIGAHVHGIRSSLQTT
jgi:exodeoxyribonuclease VII large subunit